MSGRPHPHRGHPRATNPDIEADVPEEVTQFLTELDRAVMGKNLAAAQVLYENQLPALTQQFFSNKAPRGQSLPFRPWPSLRFVKKCFSSPITELLYQMLYARHMYSDRNVSANVRLKSWETTMEALDMLMQPSIDIDLPNGWLWDILDELMFQLQTHHNKRLKIADASHFPPQAWSLGHVSTKLEQVVEKSGILKVLKDIDNGKVKPAEFFTVQGAPHIHRSLGLFAIITQMRLCVALGDYNGALQGLKPFKLLTTGRQVTQAVAAAHVSLFYNVGFSLMMLRRYADAAAALKAALGVKAVNRTYVDTLQAHVVSLLTLSATLGCLPTEDFSAFLSDPRTRTFQEDDAHLLGQGDLDRFRDVFSKAAPKFISIADTTSSTYAEFTGQEGKELQLRVFMRAVQQQVDALKLRGYLKVYSVIDAEKIDALLASSAREGENKAHTAQGHLACLKHKSMEKVIGDSSSGDLLSGEMKATAVIDFAVEGTKVSVVHRTEKVTTTQRFMQLLEQISS